MKLSQLNALMHGAIDLCTRLMMEVDRPPPLSLSLSLSLCPCHSQSPAVKLRCGVQGTMRRPCFLTTRVPILRRNSVRTTAICAASAVALSYIKKMSDATCSALNFLSMISLAGRTPEAAQSNGANAAISFFVFYLSQRLFLTIDWTCDDHGSI
jgi:hypothetical protein